MRDFLLVAVAGSILIFLAAIFFTPRDERTPVEKISDACAREYSAQGDAAVVECKLALTIKLLHDREAERLSREEDRLRRAENAAR